MPDQPAVAVRYTIVDGAHFFTSPEVPGLCAASTDLQAAFDAVAVQLYDLLPGGGFTPETPIEELRPGMTVRWVRTDE